MYYAFIQNNKINGAGQGLMLNADYNVQISEEVFNAINEDKDRYIWNGTDVVVNPDYEEIVNQRERDRLNALFMTRSDFFDGFIMAFGLSQKELRIIIEQILNSINITDIQIKVALNNYDNALNFYRKHTLFTLLNNVPIQASEEMILIFTSDIWDKFFDTKDYQELLKAIKPIEELPEPDNIEETAEL